MRADGSYGSFFPISLSPHAYNETTAQQWYPKTREEILSLCLQWQDNLPYTTGRASITEIPDNISDTDDGILKEVLACNSCSRDFKIVAPELSFYQRSKFPLPRECFSCRGARRAVFRDARLIHRRECMDCGNETHSTLASPRGVLCEPCHGERLD